MQSGHRHHGLSARNASFRSVAALVLSAIILGIVAYVSPHNKTTAITIDGRDGGAEFQGIGAISGGGGASRYLVDYPEPQRSQLMDYLFKPGFGANLQLLKLEIGADADTSDGAEASIEPVRGQIDCSAGYEWWVAEQAVARNPNVKLYGLQWGAPGWVGHSVWTDKDISYVLDWLGCAKSHHLRIDYLGGWNEKSYDIAWYVKLRQALDTHGYGYVKLIADDDVDSSNWRVAAPVYTNAAFRRSVSALGIHNTCHYPTSGYVCTSTFMARLLPQPLWENEIGRLDADRGGPPLARTINNSYIQAGVTAVLQWPIVNAKPASALPQYFQNRGLLTADQPWSGHYIVNQLTWVTAHTTQFVPQGWRYLQHANGRLGDSGTYVTYGAADASGWTMVAENSGSGPNQTVQPQHAVMHVTGSLPSHTVHVWETDFASRNPADWFVKRQDIYPTKGRFAYTIRPHTMVSFTTESGYKGQTAVPRAAAMPLPYTATPDDIAQPRDFSSIQGTFAFRPCIDNKSRACIQQIAPTKPLFWTPSSEGSTPFGVVGDETWKNYSVSTKVYLPHNAASAGIIGRMSRQSVVHQQWFNGYLFTVRGDGRWTLQKNTTDHGAVVLQKGTLLHPLDGAWHSLQLTSRGDTLNARIDGVLVATAIDSSFQSGVAGIASSWDTVQYRDLTVQTVPVRGS